MWTISVYGWLREGKPGQDTASCVFILLTFLLWEVVLCTAMPNVVSIGRVYCDVKSPFQSIFSANRHLLKKEDTTSSACPLTETSSNSSSINSMQQTSLSSYLINMNVTEAEILWVLRTVLCHDSWRSCDNVSKLFSCMFNDS